MNIDAAEDYLNLGKQSLDKNDLDKALYFFNKSKKLHPLPKIDEYIETVKKLKSQNNDDVNSSSNNGQYTEAELLEVQRMIKCKDYYEALGVDKNATLEQIKKAYRRQAIKFHPDRNKCPGSTDAFKVISSAYMCLSDPEKRKLYDTYGTDNKTEIGLRHQPRVFTTIDDDEIFDLFASMFGDGKFCKEI